MSEQQPVEGREARPPAPVAPTPAEAADAERALRISEAKFAGIVAISADAIISVDDQQRIINFNRGAEQIFGWLEGEAVGQSLDILLPHRYRETHRHHIARFAESPIPARRMGERQQIAGLRRSGEEFPAEASISKIDVEGRRIFTVVLRDITARRNAERAQTFLARAGEVLASSLDYETTVASVTRLAVPELADWCTIYTVEGDGLVRRLELAHADPARDAALQSLRGEAIGRTGAHPVIEAIAQRRPVVIADLDDARLHPACRDDVQFALLFEHGVRSALVVPLIARGELRGAMGFFAERPNRFTDDDVALAQELAVRAALAVDNARLYREAQNAVRARDDVLAVVSHDLGNPLSAIRIGTSLLLKALPPEEKEKGGWKHLDSIRQSAAQMERLIKDLIEVKRLEAGRVGLVRGPQRVSSLLAEATEMFAGIAAERGVDFHTAIAADAGAVDADRERTLQVLSNLLGNALKFTPAGGTVRLSATSLPGEVQFSVADTGPGIAPEHVDHVFERFWQATRTRQGIGLGLAIARTIVQAHGGRIWVESQPGYGSVFRFTLPAVAEPPRPD